MSDENKRIESREDVCAYISKLKYVLKNGDYIDFQKNRLSEASKPEEFTNRFTVNKLFSDENPVEILREELKLLTVADYQHTIKDDKYPNRSDMRVFGKIYADKDVYIKIRVELVSKIGYGDHHILVLSFHFAERPFSDNDFPYKK